MTSGGCPRGDAEHIRCGFPHHLQSPPLFSHPVSAHSRGQHYRSDIWNLVRSLRDCDMPHLLGRDACGQRFFGVPGSPGQMSFMQCEVSVSGRVAQRSTRVASVVEPGIMDQPSGWLSWRTEGRSTWPVFQWQRCRSFLVFSATGHLCPCPSRSVRWHLSPMTPIGTPVASVVDRGSDRPNRRWR